MNGMYLVRPSEIEMNANAGLIANQTGASAWGWDGLFAAMKKVAFLFLSFDAQGISLTLCVVVFSSRKRLRLLHLKFRRKAIFNIICLLMVHRVLCTTLIPDSKHGIDTLH